MSLSWSFNVTPYPSPQSITITTRDREEACKWISSLQGHLTDDATRGKLASFEFGCVSLKDVYISKVQWEESAGYLFANRMPEYKMYVLFYPGEPTKSSVKPNLLQLMYEGPK